MKHCTSIISKIFTAALLVGVFVMPLPSLAATTISTSSRPDVSVRGVCLRMGVLGDSLKQKLHDASRVYTKNVTTRVAVLQSQVSSRTSDTSTARKQADAQLKLYLATLEAKAHGDANKEAALAAFTSSIMDATNVRRASVDAAQKAFSSGLQVVAQARAAEVTGQVAAFENEITSALESAQASCTEGADPRDVRTNLQSSLGALDQKYKGIFADHHTYTEGLYGLTQARIAAVGEASAIFATSLDKASQALDSVLY